MEHATDRRIGAATGAAVPLATALAIAAYIVAPGAMPAGFERWAALTLLAELPLCLLGGVFAGVATIPGPAWRRILLYVALVAVLALTGFWPFFEDDLLGPILAWALAGHVCSLIWLGPDPELLAAGANAIGEDSATLIAPTAWTLAAAALGILVYAEAALGSAEDAPWRQLWWVGVGHFLLRARSIVHVYSRDFLENQRSYLDSGWALWLKGGPRRWLRR